jgi:uncharacterized membrane protein
MSQPATVDEQPHRLHAVEQRVIERLAHRTATASGHLAPPDRMTLGQRVADRVAATMGSWPFIIIQSAILAVWLVLNVTELLFKAFDPYPFILMNLALSMQAAYAAPIIMMSQNRQSVKDRQQAELDLQTDVKAEALLEELHGNMEDLRIRQWAELLVIQQQQIDLLRNMLQQQAHAGPAVSA